MIHPQEKPFWCGPAALQVALAYLGYVRSQSCLAGLCVTTEAGTDQHKMLRGIQRAGFLYDEYGNDNGRQAASWLSESFNPVLLCVDSWEHWICCLGKPGKRFVIYDPANGSGLLFLTWPALRKRWCATVETLAKLGPGPHYYAIEVFK